MPQTHRIPLCLAVLFLIMAGCPLQAQTRAKKPSTSSKTELRPETIHLHLVQFTTVQPMRWKRNDIGEQNAQAAGLPPGLFCGYLHDTNGSASNVKYEWRNEYYRGALRFHSTKLLHKQIIKATLNLRI